MLLDGLATAMTEDEYLSIPFWMLHVDINVREDYRLSIFQSLFGCFKTLYVVKFLKLFPTFNPFLDASFRFSKTE